MRSTRPSARRSACRCACGACRCANRRAPSAFRASGDSCSAIENVSSSTSAASLKPVSTSPYDHSTWGLPMREPALRVFGEVVLRPLDLHDVERARRRPGGVGGRPHALPSATRVRAAWAQTDNRIDDEGQQLEIDVDGLDGRRCGLFVHGGHGQHRLARVHRARSSTRARPSDSRGSSRRGRSPYRPGAASSSAVNTPERRASPARRSRRCS